MSGFKKLNADLREEMLKDARNVRRGSAFRAARDQADQCSLDEYIRFLSENMELVKPAPTRRLTSDFRL